MHQSITGNLMSEEETVYTQSPSQILNIRSYISAIFACAAIIVLYVLLDEKLSLPWYFSFFVYSTSIYKSMEIYASEMSQI